MRQKLPTDGHKLRTGPVVFIRWILQSGVAILKDQNWLMIILFYGTVKCTSCGQMQRRRVTDSRSETSSSADMTCDTFGLAEWAHRDSVLNQLTSHRPSVILPTESWMFGREIGNVENRICSCDSVSPG
jgi:hypothetical protein